MSGECTQPVCKLDIASGGQISVWLDFMHLYEGEYVENTPGGREEVVEASNPTPAIGAFDAPHDGALSWTPGATAVTQKVYLGTSLGDVNTADANSVLLVSPAQDANSYDASLDFDTTYFWRIDGIDSAGEIVKGTVWSFTTRNYVGIDDMESYSYQDDSRIFNAWRDGYDNATENGALGKLYVDDIRLLRQVVEIPAAADQPVIDGQLDASWDAVQAHPIDAIRRHLAIMHYGPVEQAEWMRPAPPTCGIRGESAVGQPNVCIVLLKPEEAAYVFWKSHALENAHVLSR